MPITINGSGTLTGISAGGYPDATVTADDLAGTLDLSAKTLTLPSGVGGKVVKVTSHELNNLSISTSGSWNGTTTPTAANTYSVSSFDVTMSSINNILVCNAALMVDAASAGSDGHETVAIIDDTSGETDILVASSTQYRRNFSSEPLCYGLSFYYTPSATSGNTSTTRTLKIKCHSGGGSTMYFGRNDGGDNDNILTYINVFEVAA